MKVTVTADMLLVACLFRVKLVLFCLFVVNVDQVQHIIIYILNYLLKISNLNSWRIEIAIYYNIHSELSIENFQFKIHGE